MALLRVHACLMLAGLVMGYKPAVWRGSCCACPACSPSAWHLRACPVQRLSPLPGTPILGSLLRECSRLRAVSPRCFQVRLVARAYTVVVAWPCLASVGVFGVALLAPASGGFHFGVLSVSYFRSWVPVRGGTGVCCFLTLWCVWGPSWFCLWALDLVEV
ncbi:hypothetical protein Taro_025409 [Colocasia esculenta]|uniref:Uncharacterized protein n=1 Tax=Colocasia esculenta TaxID=4460 RepID=A0A843VN93_COLES|nr:hypothetical protein [Colocasia esculenta]